MNPLTKPQDCDSIKEIRDAIDLIDHDILQLFALRHEYVKEIVKFKSGDKKGIIAQERKEQVLEQRKKWAEDSGLDPGLMEEIFRLLINKNIQLQVDMYKTNNK